MENKNIDLILNKYIVLCEKSGIKFNYEVQTANLAYINDVELSIDTIKAYNGAKRFGNGFQLNGTRFFQIGSPIPFHGLSCFCVLSPVMPKERTYVNPK